MNRYVYMGIRNVFRIPVWAAQVAARNKWSSHFNWNSNYRMVQNMVRGIITSGNVCVNIYGKENLPKRDSYLICLNHQGFFDGLALILAMEKPFRLVVMKEMKDFRFVRYVLRLLNPIYLDRSDLRDAFRMIGTCKEELQNGRTVLIFPEGTLEKQENTLLPYKAGALKAAYMAKAPIVPVVLKNSFAPFEKSGCKKCNVEVHRLEPLLYEDYNKKKTKETADRIMKISAEVLQEPQLP